MYEYIIAEDFKMDKYIFDGNSGLRYERHEIAAGRFGGGVRALGIFSRSLLKEW